VENNRPGILWKVIPVIAVIVVIFAGGTDIFSAAVHKLVSGALAELGATFLPFAVKCVIGLVVVSIANHLYYPLLKGVHKLLDSSHAGERSKDLMKRGLKAGYWVVVAFIVLSFVAPQLIGTIMGNLVLFGAAVVVALQDLAKDVAGGVVLLFAPKDKRMCDIGDTIQLVGLEAATGQLLSVDLRSSQVRTEKGVATIPNREFLARTVIKLNPPASKIIMPPGVERPKLEEKSASGAEKPEKNPLGLPSLGSSLGTILGLNGSEEPEKKK
jgi:small-conductance mechanosensitive channel